MSKITVNDIDRWFSIIHNDLYQVHCDLQKPNTQKLRKEINGLKDALLYNSCSGIGYIYKGEVYSEYNDIPFEEDDHEVTTFVDRERLVYLLEQILKG